MSRIGNQPVPISENVELQLGADNTITVKGEKGTDTLQLAPEITVEQVDGELQIRRSSEEKRVKSLHGLYRSLISNMVAGVSEGYVKQLEVIGVGYRVAMSGDVLELNLGFSHPIYFVPPDDISIEVDTKTRKNPIIKVSGINKERVGQVTAKIRSLRKPEPYKGKGVRYLDEQVRRKAGKSAAK